MKSATTQRDLFRDSPRAMAHHFRVAAETERRNPFFTPDQAESRAKFYEAEAQRLEQSA
jgi:hypothetical protein